MQNCSKCKLPLAIIEGEYQDYIYCSSCLTNVVPIYIGTCCKKPDIHTVQARISNGTFQIREQCQHCKSIKGPALSRSKFANPDSLPKVDFLSYEKRSYLKCNELNQMKAYIERLRTQQEYTPSVFESTSALLQDDHTIDSREHVYPLQAIDLQDINNLLESVYEVFVGDWDHTFSMLRETDGWSYENSPFTTQEQNWYNMTELTKRYLKVKKLLLQTQNDQ